MMDFLIFHYRTEIRCLYMHFQRFNIHTLFGYCVGVNPTLKVSFEIGNLIFGNVLNAKEGF